ncbi:protein sneaky [Microplitis demolitor]|uniref:protein sneaky n=1 Tax=Microplitis demolitor TaxID=69319 RepID=UPI0004CC9B19|nr:protein sneaky [Microplitis demolitor]
MNSKFIRDLYHDPPGTHKITRAIVGFFFGFSLAVFFYVTVILDLGFQPYTTFALGSIIVTMMSVGCALSIQIRCICLLMIPSFLGRTGRGVLKTLVVAYLITGPIFNLTYNAKEIVRTFACTSELHYNLTKMRVNLMFEPLKQVMMGMEENKANMKVVSDSVKKLMLPFVEEIEGKEAMKKFSEENDYIDEETKKVKDKRRKKRHKLDSVKTAAYYETKYREKLKNKCEDQLTKGSDRCRYMFEKSYDECYEAVTWAAAWLLCWPMKLDFVCQAVESLGGANICNPDGNIEAGVGDGYYGLKEAQKYLEKSSKDARLQYKVDLSNSSELVGIRDASDIAKSVLHEFTYRRDLFLSVMTIIKRCLAFIVLNIVRSAQKYHDKYLMDIEHDNRYITTYFKEIDSRRTLKGTPTLLPLKKIERLQYIDPYSVKLIRRERMNLIGQTLKLIFQVFMASTFIILDYLLYITLFLVHKHGKIDFTQEGEHNLHVTVRGVGLIATLMRNILNRFNVKKRTKVSVSNIECLPHPRKLQSYILYKIYVTYLMIWILAFIDGYIKRLRSKMCSFFYPKHEERRILYLYTNIQRRRLRFNEFKRSRIRVLVREQLLERNVDLWLVLRTDYPRWFGWIRWFAFGRPRCLLCNETEPRRKSNFHKCATEVCPFFYCSDCWRDIGEICYACTPDYLDSNDESDVLDSDEENARINAASDESYFWHHCVIS